MVLRATTCLRRLGGDRRGERQAGQFFANRKVTAAAIIDSWHQPSVEAVAGRHVLALQDTTALSFATGGDAQSARGGAARRGLGPLNQGNAHGLLAHVMLAVDADSGDCLGLLGGTVWNRPGLVSTAEHKRPLSERESRRWVETAEQARPRLDQAAQVTVVHDREGDLYPLWARVPRQGMHLLSRVMLDRRLSGGGLLFDAAACFALADRRQLELRAQPPQRPQARTATLELRFGAVTIARPVNEKDRSLAAAVPLTLVEVREVDPPAAAEPIHWRLLTTHAVADLAQAWRIVGWYQARWTIEQLFRILKSQGLRLEDSQVTTAERLGKLTAAAVKAACLTLQLVQAREGVRHRPARPMFDAAEVDTLAALSPTLEGRVARQRNPHPPRSLAHAAWVIARLGSWHGYGRPPGPITMHRGLERFFAIHQGRMLATQT
jgi:Transposase DDE domain